MVILLDKNIFIGVKLQDIPLFWLLFVLYNCILAFYVFLVCIHMDMYWF